MGFMMGSGIAVLCGLVVVLGVGVGLPTAPLILVQALCWSGGLISVVRGGHRAFKTGVNTDLVAYCLVLGLYLSGSVTWWGKP